jgi:hypothetical protein
VSIYDGKYIFPTTTPKFPKYKKGIKPTKSKKEDLKKFLASSKVYTFANPLDRGLKKYTQQGILPYL